MRVLFSIVFGLLRTPALIYFVCTGFFAWVTLSLFNIVTLPFRYILEKIAGSNLAHVAGVIVFLVLYRAMYESVVAVYTFIFRTSEFTPYPLLMRIYLEREVVASGFPSFLPTDMTFPFELIPRFSNLVQDEIVIGTILTSEFYVGDLMVGWLFVLGLWGIWIARAVRHTLALARLD
jgi:hypothetical protein